MLVILGKNGSGKTFLANKLFDLGFYRSVNYTTRPKRKNEINDLDYKFITEEEFENLIDKEYFVEFKKHNGFYYGTPKKNLKSNAILLAGDIAKIRKFSIEDVVPIYIDADIKTRYKRVDERGESKEKIFKRFHDENFSYLYDFNGFFINNNNSDEKSLQTITQIIDSNGNIVDRTLISNNYNFVESQINIVPEWSYNEMLTFLQFEEYLMRKIMLIFDINNSNSYSKVLEYYYDHL